MFFWWWCLPFSATFKVRWSGFRWFFVHFGDIARLIFWPDMAIVLPKGSTSLPSAVLELWSFTSSDLDQPLLFPFAPQKKIIMENILVLSSTYFELKNNIQKQCGTQQLVLVCILTMCIFIGQPSWLLRHFFVWMICTYRCYIPTLLLVLITLVTFPDQCILKDGSWEGT